MVASRVVRSSRRYRSTGLRAATRHRFRSFEARLEVRRPVAFDPGAAVAVIGMSCRLPGAASPQAFWRLLREGRDAIVETPAERWEMYGLAGPDDGLPGLRYGGFLDEVDRFDAGFFGISPREAARDGPPAAARAGAGWEALEDAGSSPARSPATQAGVYVGAIAGDYASSLSASTQTRWPARRSPARSAASSPTGVSYALGLRGPSMTVDTGAVIVARRRPPRLPEPALRRVDARAGGRRAAEPRPAASAGAVQARRTVARRALLHVRRARERLRARRGRRRRRAQARSSRRVADGDPVYGVIRGSAVNNDGGGDGLDGARSGGAGADAAVRLRAGRGSRPGTCSTSSSTARERRWATRSRPPRSARVLGAGRPPARPLRGRVGQDERRATWKPRRASSGS